MNSNIKNNSIWKWATLFLLLCNTTLLLLIYYRPKPPHPHNMRQGGSAQLDAFIIDELDLTPSQQKKFHQLKHEHRKHISELQKQGRKLRNAYFLELKTRLVNDSTVIEKLNAIAENQRLIEYYTFEHFAALRSICNKAQKTAFDNIILEVLQRMAPRPPAPPTPPNTPNSPTPPPPVE